MLPISVEEQTYTDFDWYAIDRQGRIAQFLTGGSVLLPSAIASDSEVLELLSTYFNNLEERGEAVLHSDSQEYSRLRHASLNPNDQVPFAQKMSRRGLYSYDVNIGREVGEYFRVSSPSLELHMSEVPAEVANALRRFQLPNTSFSDDTVVSDNDIQKMAD